MLASTPLAKGYFGSVHVTIQQEREWRRLVKTHVAATINEENDFVFHTIDTSLWRRIRHKHNFQVFRRRKQTKTTNQFNSSFLTQSTIDSQVTTPQYMIGLGSVDGSLEEILYGLANQTHEETQAAKSFMGLNTLDSTVLHTVDTATDHDPFQYMGIKWTLCKVSMQRPRDACYLKAMGTSRDRRGNRYGYVVIQSIDLPNCPPFAPQVAIRADCLFTFILRERIDGSVDVFSRGYLDATGDKKPYGDHLSTSITADVLSSMRQSAQCGEAKKLTLLAAYNMHDLTKQPDLTETKYCCICRKKHSVFSQLKTCRICGDPVCMSCHIKKVVFALPDLTLCKVTCCPTCVVKAMNMEVRPAEEAYSLLVDHHVLRRENLESIDYSQSESAGMMIPLSHQDRLSTIMSTGVPEEDVETTVEYLLQSKRKQSASSPVLCAIAVENNKPTQLTLLEAPPVEQPVVRADQDAMYHQLLIISNRVHRVSAMTQANEEMMLQICADASQLLANSSSSSNTSHGNWGTRMEASRLLKAMM